MFEECKQDIMDLLCFAFEEYGSSTLCKKELTENGHIKQSFNHIVADITMIPAEKNRLYLRRYDVKSIKNDNRFSFILGHAAMLFSNSSLKFREELLAEETIKGVITLKQSVFKQIVIPAAIILLNNDCETTWFTAVDNIEKVLDLILGDFSNIAPLYFATTVSSENLLPEFYNGDDKLIENSLEGNIVKPLGEIAEIINGKGARRGEYANVGIPYLRARDIQNSKIIQSDVFISKENVGYYSKQLIQEGDILLTKYFGQNKIAIVTSKDVPAIASNGLFIIRPFDVSECYLYNYLTSKTGSEIFNKQLNRVQKGVTIPSISLADLKKIEVPIFEQDIMQNLTEVESISKEKVLETTKKLIRQVTLGVELEKSVMESLIATGWDKNRFEIAKSIRIEIGNHKQWIPDLAYILPDERKVIIEVKSDVTRINPAWVQAVSQILSHENDFIFVLTTGLYYEVHVSGVSHSLKMTQPPTIDEILSWEKEVH